VWPTPEDRPFSSTRADLKPECYNPCVVLSTIHTFFIDYPFKGNTKLSKNIHRGGPHRRIRSSGGGGHTGGSASKSNISANSNLYSKGLQGMNQGVVGRVLIQKTACKKSHVSVPLSTSRKVAQPSFKIIPTRRTYNNCSYCSGQ
jgi:hypothetical protein